MLKKFQELLHQYKLEVFHNEHGKPSLDEITSECMHVTEEILEEKFHYHFHKLPDANRAEIINMINNYTREAVLPRLWRNWYCGNWFWKSALRLLYT